MKKINNKIKPRRAMVINFATVVLIAAAAVLVFLNIRPANAPDESGSTAGGDVTVKVEVCCPQIFEEKNFKRLDSAVKESGLLDGGETLVDCEVSLGDGATLMDALTLACENSGLAVDVRHSEIYGDYLRDVGGLAEGACTKRSGWVYTVNGSSPELAMNKISAADGDGLRVEFIVY